VGFVNGLLIEAQVDDLVETLLLVRESGYGIQLG